jgi:hypothetical protein
MKVSAHITLWGSAIFALFCLGYALAGFSSIDAMADEATRSDARGYAFFWLFMGGIGIATALGSWWMVKHGDD